MKGYKLLKLHTNQIFVSCNVKFHEHIFPFLSTSTPPNTNFFPYSLIPSTHSKETVTVDLPILTTSPVEDFDHHHTITRSKRVSKFPSYLDDFICAKTASITHHNSPYSINIVLDYSLLSPHHKNYIICMSAVKEPPSFS